MASPAFPPFSPIPSSSPPLERFNDGDDDEMLCPDSEPERVAMRQRMRNERGWNSIEMDVEGSGDGSDDEHKDKGDEMDQDEEQTGGQEVRGLGEKERGRVGTRGKPDVVRNEGQPTTSSTRRQPLPRPSPGNPSTSANNNYNKEEGELPTNSNHHNMDHNGYKDDDVQVKGLTTKESKARPKSRSKSTSISVPNVVSTAPRIKPTTGSTVSIINSKPKSKSNPNSKSESESSISKALLPTTKTSTLNPLEPTVAQSVNPSLSKKTLNQNKQNNTKEKNNVPTTNALTKPKPKSQSQSQSKPNSKPNLGFLFKKRPLSPNRIRSVGLSSSSTDLDKINVNVDINVDPRMGNELKDAVQEEGEDGEREDVEEEERGNKGKAKARGRGKRRTSLARAATTPTSDNDSHRSGSRSIVNDPRVEYVTMSAIKKKSMDRMKIEAGKGREEVEERTDRDGDREEEEAGQVEKSLGKVKEKRKSLLDSKKSSILTDDGSTSTASKSKPVSKSTSKIDSNSPTKSSSSLSSSSKKKVNRSRPSVLVPDSEGGSSGADEIEISYSTSAPKRKVRLDFGQCEWLFSDDEKEKDKNKRAGDEEKGQDEDEGGDEDTDEDDDQDEDEDETRDGEEVVDDKNGNDMDAHKKRKKRDLKVGLERFRFKKDSSKEDEEENGQDEDDDRAAKVEKRNQVRKNVLNGKTSKAVGVRRRALKTTKISRGDSSSSSGSESDSDLGGSTVSSFISSLPGGTSTSTSASTSKTKLDAFQIIKAASLSPKSKEFKIPTSYLQALSDCPICLKAFREIFPSRAKIDKDKDGGDGKGKKSKGKGKEVVTPAPAPKRQISTTKISSHLRSCSRLYSFPLSDLLLTIEESILSLDLTNSKQESDSLFLRTLRRSKLIGFSGGLVEVEGFETGNVELEKVRKEIAGYRKGGGGGKVGRAAREIRLTRRRRREEDEKTRSKRGDGKNDKENKNMVIGTEDEEMVTDRDTKSEDTGRKTKGKGKKRDPEAEIIREWGSGSGLTQFVNTQRGVLLEGKKGKGLNTVPNVSKSNDNQTPIDVANTATQIFDPSSVAERFERDGKGKVVRLLANKGGENLKSNDSSPKALNSLWEAASGRLEYAPMVERNVPCCPPNPSPLGDLGDNTLWNGNLEHTIESTNPATVPLPPSPPSSHFSSSSLSFNPPSPLCSPLPSPPPSPPPRPSSSSSSVLILPSSKEPLQNIESLSPQPPAPGEHRHEVLEVKPSQERRWLRPLDYRYREDQVAKDPLSDYQETLLDSDSDIQILPARSRNQTQSRKPSPSQGANVERKSNQCAEVASDPAEDLLSPNTGFPITTFLSSSPVPHHQIHLEEEMGPKAQLPLPTPPPSSPVPFDEEPLLVPNPPRLDSDVPGAKAERSFSSPLQTLNPLSNSPSIDNDVIESEKSDYELPPPIDIDWLRSEKNTGFSNEMGERDEPYADGEGELDYEGMGGGKGMLTVEWGDWGDHNKEENEDIGFLAQDQDGDKVDDLERGTLGRAGIFETNDVDPRSEQQAREEHPPKAKQKASKPVKRQEFETSSTPSSSSTRPRPKQPSFPPKPNSKSMPNYSSWSHARLVSQLSAWGFKTSSNNKAMVKLMENCWKRMNNDGGEGKESNEEENTGEMPITGTEHRKMAGRKKVGAAEKSNFKAGSKKKEKAPERKKEETAEAFTDDDDNGDNPLRRHKEDHYEDDEEECFYFDSGQDDESDLEGNNARRKKPPETKTTKEKINAAESSSLTTAARGRGRGSGVARGRLDFSKTKPGGNSSSKNTKGKSKTTTVNAVHPPRVDRNQQSIEPTKRFVNSSKIISEAECSEQHDLSSSESERFDFGDSNEEENQDENQATVRKATKKVRLGGKSKKSSTKDKNLEMKEPKKGQGRTKKQRKGGDGEEEEEVDDRSVSEKMRDAVLKDEKLYLRILRYEPINFEDFIKLAKDKSIKASRISIRNFLDQQSIAFYNAQPDGRVGSSRRRHP